LAADTPELTRHFPDDEPAADLRCGRKRLDSLDAGNPN
jgi:hypothetical protein